MVLCSQDLLVVQISQRSNHNSINWFLVTLNLCTQIFQYYELLCMSSFMWLEIFSCFSSCVNRVRLGALWPRVTGSRTRMANVYLRDTDHPANTATSLTLYVSRCCWSPKISTRQTSTVFWVPFVDNVSCWYISSCWSICLKMMVSLSH